MDMESENLLLDELLLKWEGVYKKGLLSFWILLLLNERQSYAYEMTGELQKISKGTISVDEKSMYRALSRYEKNGILKSKQKKSDIGPVRRYYYLSELGKELLRRFIERNILVFTIPEVESQIRRQIKDRSINKENPI